MFSKSKTLNSVIVLIVLTLIAYLIGLDIYRNFDVILALEINWIALVSGMTLIIISLITVSYSIYISIQALGASLSSPREVILVNSALQPTKYLPGGSLVNAVAQGFGLGKIKGISSNVAYAAPFMAIFLNFVSAVFLASIAYVASGQHRIDILAMFAAVNLATLSLSISQVRKAFLAAGNKFLNEKINNLWAILFNARPAQIVLSTLWLIVFWVLAGTGVFFVAVACSPISFDNYFMFFGAYILSVALGYLAIIFPGGIGVREGILIFLLGQFLPKPWPSVIALCARVAWTLAESLVALCAFYLLKNRKKAV